MQLLRPRAESEQRGDRDLVVGVDEDQVLGEDEADDGRSADVVHGHAREARLVDGSHHVEGELVG